MTVVMGLTVGRSRHDDDWWLFVLLVVCSRKDFLITVNLRLKYYGVAGVTHFPFIPDQIDIICFY
jgi:hypothetical protein